ncbi:MAG TPA: CDP-diacylglycerol--glycerol-3-phosphate 3-phosphatidyltransferase [Bacilli bacterium]|nr:CDP-diacylglycerol--glycerol-3-phosphate 3-phosphatidyltransferase [Bacilli bacterium]
MNLPNKLTIVRVMMIPLIIIVAMITSLQSTFLINPVGNLQGLTTGNLIILIIFIVASFTDFLDGYIARKYNLITTFGKFMDPLADKVLVLAAIVVLLEQGRIPGWAVTLILAREFIVTGIRLVVISSNNQKVIAAGLMGKIKTNLQIFMIIFLLADGLPFSLINHNLGYWVNQIFIYAAVLVTVVSGIQYFNQSKEIILESK